MRKLYIAIVCLVLSGQFDAMASDHPVQARMRADAAVVAPGTAMRLGIHLTMEEGWHTYWQYSGDAGLPIQVEWQSSIGAEVGPLQWPLPSKYREEGDLTVYGYADEVMLIAAAKVPLALAPGDTLHLAAEVSWLVCRELCIPGAASLKLALPVAAASVVSADLPLFDYYAALVPGPLDEQVVVDLTIHEAEAVTVDMRVERAGETFIQTDRTPDFYPLATDNFAFFAHSPAANHVALRLEPYGTEPIERLRGVLVYTIDGVPRAGVVELDLATAPRSARVDLLQRDYRSVSDDHNRALWVYIAFAILGGLILNLMPCVLPVISLKILGFVGQAGTETGRMRRLGWAFCAGIVATFLTLALIVLVLKSSGELIGWGFQFQYPGFVMAMSALVFALALSLFGVYEILLPVSSSNLGGLPEREGLLGSFLNGVLATILATPCTAPFLGTALGFAFAQTAGVVVAIFAAIGVGMALPYVVLALKPDWMELIPKPGPWMVRFKQLMGFLLVATVLWLLWVLGNQVGVEGVIWTSTFLLVLSVACWVWGQWGGIQYSRRSRWIVRLVVLALLAGGYGFLLHPVLVTERKLAVEPTAGALAWQPFSIMGVEELVASGRMVFIDFTAEWCWTCKVNERVVLAQDQVRDKFAEHNVALVKADWTNRNPEITRLLQAFGRSGVPLYVIFPPGQPDYPLVLPEVITADLVTAKLNEAAGVE